MRNKLDYKFKIIVVNGGKESTVKYEVKMYKRNFILIRDRDLA